MSAKRAVIYARVSTDEQAEKGYSLPSQLEACRKYASERGMIVIAEFQDDISGAKLDRPGLSAIRDLIRKGDVDAVIIYCTDRLSRKLAHALILRDEFEKYNVERHTVMRGKATDNAEQRMVENIESVFAEYEREKIRERTQRGKFSAAKKGLILSGGKPPYGYRLIDGKLVIHDEEADLVRSIYQWYLNGDVYKTIARKLSEMGIPTPYEKYERMGRKRVRMSCMWDSSTVSRILSCEAYIGRYRFGKVIGTAGAGGRESKRKQSLFLSPQ